MLDGVARSWRRSWRRNHCQPRLRALVALLCRGSSRSWTWADDRSLFARDQTCPARSSAGATRGDREGIRGRERPGQGPRCANSDTLRRVPQIAQTADHALRILEELGMGEPLSASQLCQRLDINRTVAHRLLKTLEARGFVMKKGTTFAIGATLIRLAGTVEPDLRMIAVPCMAAVAQQTHESVVLHVVDGQQAVVLEQAVATEHLVQVSHRLGSRHPLFSGASGRAILAFLPDKEVAKVLKGTDDLDAIERSLELIREQHFAVSHDELQMGVHGIAVPLFGADETAIGSIAILVPTSRAQNLETHLDALWRASSEIRAQHSSRAV